ncbi:hypothetical protein ACTXP3_26960, partial [Klebsiella pneumoniae]|uniref:hypothetical protein n=1 Tax=Klebsiella pneumoniae TaxID=573 RepID=UPI003FD3DC6C
MVVRYGCLVGDGLSRTVGMGLWGLGPGLCVLAGAAFGVFKAKLPSFVKAGIAAAAVVAVVLMLSIDAKFWGVVVMGG